MKCSKCGVCCRLFRINLTEEEYKSGRYRTEFEEFGLVEDFKEAEMCGANIIMPNDDGSCMYLKEGRCSIHKTRPQSCRNFFCADKRFDNMIKKIDEYKKASIKRVE
ncbi:MAG: YkgJ family cysteine cluster protein [Nanoarchaeota archaeon]|nr:YkgJ family cysteine cluster protein [Nanoarchaeota archaeon]